MRSQPFAPTARGDALGTEPGLADYSYHSLLTLRQAMERYGRPRVLYTDNDSKFRLTPALGGEPLLHLP